MNNAIVGIFVAIAAIFPFNIQQIEQQPPNQGVREEVVKVEKTKKPAKKNKKTKKPTKPSYSPPVQVYVPSGGWVKQCKKWAKRAGITLTPAAIRLIDVESNCNPCIVHGGAIDCSYNGELAFGIPQALPSYKTGCGSNPVCQLKWMDRYVKDRYGGWDEAWAFWLANNWY